MPKKPGAKPYDDRAAIYRMVELLAANPSLKIRRAAREAARRLGLPGEPSVHEERLRKKYCRLRDAGDQALLSGSARVEAAIEEIFASREAAETQSRERLAAKEQEAISLGLDVGGREDLDPYLERLEREMEKLEAYARGSELVPMMLLAQYRTAAEAKAKLAANVEQNNLLKNQVEVVRTIRDLRIFLLGIRTAGSSPGTEPFGEESKKIGEEPRNSGEVPPVPGEE